MSAVTELMGRLPSNEGRRAMRLHNRAKSMPRKAVAGMKVRLEVLPVQGDRVIEIGEEPDFTK